MASVRVKIEGEKGAISLRALQIGINTELRILSDLDSALSGVSRGSLDWLVTALSTSNSLEVIADSHSRIENRNVGLEVAQLFVTGLQKIEIEGETPPYFSDLSLRSAKRLLGLIGRNGATGLEVSTPTLDPVKLTSKAAVNIARLLPVRDSAIGSIEGRMEMVSIHTNPRFVVYDARTKKAISCNFNSEQLDRVKDALGHRVNVSGIVHYNYRGEPVRVDIEDIRRLRTEAELPTVDDLTGIAPDFTDGLDSVEYLRRLRVG